MDHLEDNDIKAVWAYQYARRRGSVAARLALVTLMGIIKEPVRCRRRSPDSSSGRAALRHTHRRVE